MWRYIYIYIILANSCAKSASLAPRGQVLTSHLLQALQGSHPGLARYLWFSPKISMKNCREPERMAFNNVLSSSTVEILDDLLVAQFWGTSIYNYPPWTSMRWCDYSGSPKIIEKSNACGKGFPMQKKCKAGVVFKFCREMLCPKFPRNQWNPPISSASSTFGRIGQCMSM